MKKMALFGLAALCVGVLATGCSWFKDCEKKCCGDKECPMMQNSSSADGCSAAEAASCPKQ